LREKYLKAVVQVEELCGVIGVPVFSVPGFEADDCEAYIVSKFRNRHSLVYAASNDSDLYQLLDFHNFRIYKKDLEGVVDLAKLYQQIGLSPTDYMWSTALMGTHNDIEGIPRVGAKTAIKAVKDKSLLRTYMEQHGDLVTRNLGLIKLPHRDFPRDIAFPKRTGIFDARALYKWCARYDINVMGFMVEAFEQIGQP
jgi:5'-3' exonuclease